MGAHGPVRFTDAERNIAFWQKVDRTDPDWCWEWTAAAYPGGYGSFGIGGRAHTRAHRYAYETLVGPIPEGLVLDHLCVNPPCVNPKHLEPVTQKINAQRAHPFPPTCVRGHAWTPESVYRRPSDGSRVCRVCHRDWARERKARQRWLTEDELA